MTGYTRQDTSNNIANGNVIDADDLDGEFDALESAFNSSTGHNHDGTSGEGAPILVVGPAQDIVTTSSQMAPKTDDTYDLGSATNKWKDLYVDGVAYLDAVNITGGSITGITDLTVADGGTGASSFTANSVLLGNGTSAFQVVPPGTSGNVLTSNGTTWASTTPPASYTNSSVDAHLNTSTAASGEVLSWTGSDYDWVPTSAGTFSSFGTRNLAAITTLPALTTGTDNFVVGQNAGNALTSAVSSVIIGKDAGKANTDNTIIAIGQSSATLATGQDTTAVGRSSAAAITTGTGSTAFGALTLQSATGSGNTAVGKWAGRYITSSNNNTALGNQALHGDSVSFLTGEGNVGLGFETGYDLTTGAYNFLGGFQTGSNITIGSNNVVIGKTAGNTLTTGNNNIILGESANASSATVSNEITLGNSSISTLRCQVTTITSLSDVRDKTDIQPLNAGLNFIKNLKPVSFTWNMRDGGKVGEIDTGFIAQDLQSAQIETGVTIPGLVFNANPERLEAGYGKLIPVLVQAIKDLSEEVKNLKT